MARKLLAVETLPHDEAAGIDMYKGSEVAADDSVRHIYFPGARIPCKALKTKLTPGIDVDAWQGLKPIRSRPFPKPRNGKAAAKVINDLGDEVMKVVRA